MPVCQAYVVIAANATIQCFQASMDPGFLRDDADKECPTLK